MKRLLLLSALLLTAAGVFAQAAPDVEALAAQERGRIDAERARLKAELFEQERACYQRFAVNDCLRKARRQQRQAQAELRQREVRLNDEERLRKAAVRQERAAEPAPAE